MKSVVIVTLFTLVCISCNDKRGEYKPPPSKKHDTTIILGIALAPTAKEILNGLMERIIIDSSDIIYQEDSVTWKKTVGVDTFYRVGYQSWIDSTNTGWLDSVPNSKPGIAWWPTNKKFVRSGWENADSAFRELEKFIKR